MFRQPARDPTSPDADIGKAVNARQPTGCGSRPQGVDAEDIAKVLTAARLTSPRAAAEPGRADLPVRRSYTSASFDAALSAARPENRKRSLDDLDANLLARSSTRPMETRVKAWQRLCEAWDVKPWPITFDAIKNVCASLRQGGYTSVEGYLQAAFWYQEKEFGIEVEPLLCRAARRLAKAATRGLVAGLRRRRPDPSGRHRPLHGRLRHHQRPHCGVLVHDAGD